VRIEECRPISKRKTWMLVERNGELVTPPPGFTIAYNPSRAAPVQAEASAAQA